jgi:hypothetical protein
MIEKIEPINEKEEIVEEADKGVKKKSPKKEDEEYTPPGSKRGFQDWDTQKRGW